MELKLKSKLKLSNMCTYVISHLNQHLGYSDIGTGCLDIGPGMDISTSAWLLVQISRHWSRCLGNTSGVSLLVQVSGYLSEVSGFWPRSSH